MTGRWVLHLDLDAFFASVEQLTRPTLRATTRGRNQPDRRAIYTGPAGGGLLPLHEASSSVIIPRECISDDGTVTRQPITE